MCTTQQSLEDGINNFLIIVAWLWEDALYRLTWYRMRAPDFYAISAMDTSSKEIVKYPVIPKEQPWYFVHDYGNQIINSYRRYGGIIF